MPVQTLCMHDSLFVIYIALFSACTVTQWKIKMQTIQYRRTRIWEMKRDKYTKTLAKNQVCELFQMRDIGKKGLPKFIKLCMETPCWCPCQEVSKKFFRASVWSKNKGGGGGGRYSVTALRFLWADLLISCGRKADSYKKKVCSF